MRAEDVGWTANKIVLGKLSGRNAFKQRVQELGIPVDSETELNAAFARFKDLADRKSDIFDEDIQALFSDESVTPESEHFKLVSLSQAAQAVLNEGKLLSIAGRESRKAADGNGPVDATLKAIEAQVDSGSELLLYSVNAITTGTESQGEVTVRLSRAGRIVNGVGADPDIIVASAKAYINALNKLQSNTDRVNPQAGV